MSPSTTLAGYIYSLKGAVAMRWSGASTGERPGLAPDKKERNMSLRDEIATALNRHSAENKSDTPDFILADYLMACLDAFDRATARRTNWHTAEPAAPPEVEALPRRTLSGPGSAG